MRRAGMAGAIVGFDLAEALITAKALGAKNDQALVEYVTAMEIAAVIASSRQAQSPK